MFHISPEDGHRRALDAKRQVGRRGATAKHVPDWTFIILSIADLGILVSRYYPPAGGGNIPADGLVELAMGLGNKGKWSGRRR